MIGDLLELRPLWAARLKKMRNAYTHRRKGGEAFTRDELREMALFGRIVFDVSLMLDLGLPVDTCRERVHRWSDYSFAMRDARKHRDGQIPTR